MKKLIMLLLIICLSAGVANATMRKGPYLIYPGVNTEMMVLWQLTGSQTCTLEWGEDTSYSSGSVQTTEFGNDHQHEYVISNLTPGMKYYYRVTEDISHTGTFYAAPLDTATSVKFFAYGDVKSGIDDHNIINARVIETYEADPDYQTFTLFTGDWVTDGSLEADWDDQHFNPIMPNNMIVLANLPKQGCIGNHEWDAAKGTTLYDKYYPYPYPYGADNANLFWSFDYGPAHIVVIDQYAADFNTGSAQWNWIANDLATTDKEWKFIQMHEPGYSASGGHADDWEVREWIQPLCEMYEVDMVINGHCHYYARCLKHNVTCITAGNAGASLSTPDMLHSPYIVTAEKIHGFCKIAINGSNLDFEARRIDGTLIESFTLSHPHPTELPFSDGFEDTTEYSSGDIGDSWDISDKRYVVRQSDANSGLQACQTVGAAGNNHWVQRAISTKGYSNIKVEYARKTEGMDQGEFLYVEWSADNQTWNNLESTQVTDWAGASFTCGSGADEQPGFRVRFRTNGNRKTEFGYIDDVRISGTPSGPQYVISGLIRESDLTPIEGVSVDADSGGGSDTTDQTGYYGVTVPDSWSGTVTPTKAGWTFEPVDRSYSNVTADQTNQHYTGTYAGAPEIYVYDIDMSGYEPKGGRWAAKATIWIKDTELTDIADATVTGDWTGAAPESGVQGVTLGDGKVTIESGAVKDGGDYTFTVTDVTATGYTYNSSLNNETSDSITLPEPGAELDMYVYDIAMTSGGPAQGGKYWGIATVWIKDVCDVDVSGATITADWTGAAPEEGVQEVTEDGKATFTSGKVKNGGTFTFTVNDVTATGYTYNSTLNNETSDSITAP